MSDDLEYWHVERYVDLGNVSFWHEVAWLLRKQWESEDRMREQCAMIADRDIVAHSPNARWRIRVTKEETVFDSEGAEQ